MSLSFDKATSRMKVHIVKARNLCCKAREGKRQDRCGVSCSGDLILLLVLKRPYITLEEFKTHFYFHG